MTTIFLAIDIAAYQEIVLTSLSQIQSTSLVLIGIAILLQILSIILSLRNGNSRDADRPLGHLYRSILYMFLLSFYSSWIIPYTGFAIVIQKGYSFSESEMKTYRQDVLAKTLDRLNKAKYGGTAAEDELLRKNGHSNEFIAELNKNAESRKYYLSLAKQKELSVQLSGGKGDDTSWFDKLIDGVSLMVLGGPAKIAALAVLPLVRDISIVLVEIMTLLVTVFFPLAFVYSSIPRMEDTVIPIFMLIIAIRLWLIIILGLDQLRFTFDEIYNKVDMPAGDVNFQIIYPWVFIGLYIFTPKVLEIFWPSRASNLGSLVNVGVTYMMNAAKTALTKGMSSLSGSM
jgi:hypothetical protein